MKKVTDKNLIKELDDLFLYGRMNTLLFVWMVQHNVWIEHNLEDAEGIMDQIMAYEWGWATDD